MFITQDELKKRLESSINLNNILNPDEKQEREKCEQAEKDVDRILEGVLINRTESEKTGIQGKLKGDENVPTIFRDIIATQAALGAKPKELKKAWGVSDATVSNYKHGIPNRSNPDAKSNKEVTDVIQKVTGRIRNKVCEKIELALEAMTPEKFSDEGIKTLSSVSSNLARTIQALENKKDDGSKIDNRVQTIIYAPQTAQLEEYPVMEMAR